MDVSNRLLKRLTVFGVPIGLITAIVVGASSPDPQVDRDKATAAEIGITPPESRTYTCTAGEVPALARHLEQRFGMAGNTRIVADPRRNQVVVIAPADVQAQVARCVHPSSVPSGQQTERAAQAPPAMHAATWPSEHGSRQEIQLRQYSARELEASLIRTLGKRLTPLSPPAEGQSAYALQLRGGGAVWVAVDPTANRVRLEGATAAVHSARQLVHVMDHAAQPAGCRLELVALNMANAGDVWPVIQAVQAQQAAPPAAQGAVPPLPPGVQIPTAPPVDVERGGDRKLEPRLPGDDSQTTRILPLPGARGPAVPGQEQGLLGPVQIEILEGLDVLVIRGDERDVQRVVEILEQIEQLAGEAELAIRVAMLRHVDSVALGTLLEQVYSEVFAARMGSLSITPLGKPNAVLLVGREETIQTALDLVAKLDRPVPPATQFQVFRLKRLPAQTALESVQAFFAQQGQRPGAQQQQQQQQGVQPGSLAPRVQVVADFRSNSLIVRANPRELAEVAALLERIDAETSAAINEVRVFKLRNTLAETLAPVLRDAITGQIYGQRAERGPAAARPVSGVQQDFEPKSTRLQFVTVDPRGRQVLRSGILTDAQVTADPRTNAVIVTASSESMPLIEALIQQLDQPPEIESQVKVFTLVNSDASAMMDMLQTIFGTAGAAEGIAVRTGVEVDETTLVGLRFAVDIRTNSIIVTGSTGALTVVEAILLRLDESDVRNRRTTVYRLKNAPAIDVATAVNEYLRRERRVGQVVPGLLSAFEQIEREVIVVPEPVSNSLIVSATPRFFEEISQLVEELDERPPMVMIQVLIAEVTLQNIDEFGVELGLQDSILFDRSAIIGAGDAATLAPGFLFNSATLGNSARPASLATREDVGGQAITSLDVGRTNPELGFGGLVLSASSESISVLIRALQMCQRLQVLSRPQVMTMDNQSALIHVGQDVPTIQASEITQFGVINSILYRQVGLILTVTPRISPDRLVVMELSAEKSEVGPITEGIPVAVTEGEVVRSPRINITTTRTVVSAMDGQTVVLGGLISTSDTDLKRRVPLLADIPVLGHLFQYKRQDKRRTELLIVMTPRIVDKLEDAEAIKRAEAARMHWCLCDVMALHDGDGLGKNGPSWYDGDSAVIYPDLDPTLKSMQELAVPGEQAAPPVTPEIIPSPEATPLPQSGPVPVMPSPPTVVPPGAVPQPAPVLPPAALQVPSNAKTSPQSTAAPQDPVEWGQLREETPGNGNVLRAAVPPPMDQPPAGQVQPAGYYGQPTMR